MKLEEERNADDGLSDVADDILTGDDATGEDDLPVDTLSDTDEEVR